MAAKVQGDHQRRAGGVLKQGVLGLPGGWPRDDMKGDRSAEGVDEVARGGRVVQVLNDDGQIIHGKRNGRPKQQQQTEWKCERQRQGEPVPHNLREFFASLRNDSPHRPYSSFAPFPCCPAFSTTATNPPSTDYFSSSPPP